MYQKPSVSEISQNVHKFVYPDGKELYVVGTAHVSKQSVELVEQTINEINPDVIAIELDDKRFEAITNPNKYDNLDIIKIIKEKQIFFFIGQFMLSVFQRKISKKTNSKPGEEFIKAADMAKEKNVKLALVDRNVGITLKRAWNLNSFWGKSKILASLLFSSSKGSKIETEEIEKLKTTDALTSMIKELGEEMPLVKKAIIDERDLYLSGMIQQNLGQKTVAIVGAGHVPGIIKHLEEEITQATLDEISIVPKPSFLGKVMPWFIPTLIMGLFIGGLFLGDFKQSKDGIIFWALITASLSGLGAAISLGHPLTILAAFFAAPFTTLNPALGSGMVAGLVQAIVTPPRVKDFNTVQDDSLKLTGWWRNRLTRLLLVVLLSSIGAAVGMFISIPVLAKIFTH